VLSFKYCSYVTDHCLLTLMKAVQKKDQVVGLDLYRCGSVTDASILNALKLFPNLEYLDLGSCFSLTDACVKFFMPHGKKLKGVVIANTKLTEEILIDLGTHPCLIRLDIQRCSFAPAVVDEQRLATPKLQIIGPEPSYYQHFKAKKNPHSNTMG